MTSSRAVIGAIAGAIIAIVWQVLGADALLWTILLGAVGAIIGHFLDQPARLIEYLQRLERS
jgi:uncharacterized membrane protein